MFAHSCANVSDVSPAVSNHRAMFAGHIDLCLRWLEVTGLKYGAARRRQLERDDKYRQDHIVQALSHAQVLENLD